ARGGRVHRGQPRIGGRRGMSSAAQRVIVAGGGPVGLMTALGLAHAGVPVFLIEQEPALTADLRAGSYHPPTLEAMAPYGITARMLERGIQVPIGKIRIPKIPTGGRTGNSV